MSAATQPRDDIHQKLNDTKNKLAELEIELPTFEKLVSDNEGLETELRKRKANLDELAAQKLRTISAKELLEQHTSDIQEARRLLDVLDKEAKVQDHLTTIKELDSELAALQASYKQDMLKAVENLIKTFSGLGAKRKRWLELRSNVHDEIHSLSGVPVKDYFRNREPQEWQALEEALKTLEEHGVSSAIYSLPDNLTRGYNNEGVTQVALPPETAEVLRGVNPGWVDNRPTMPYSLVLDLAKELVTALPYKQ